MTVGPGESSVSAFGHSMILLEDPAGDTVAYSFGQSDYRGVGLVVRALQGTVEAGAGEIAWAAARDGYLSAGRAIWIQRLALLPDQVASLRTELVAEAGFFPYATFDENCTTTLRDLLDRAVDGTIRAQTYDAPVQGSLRDRIQPLVRRHLSLSALSALALTDRVDGVASRWEAMFLPETLRSGLRDVVVPDVAGSPVPLVVGEEFLGSEPRDIASRVPFWLSGLVLGLVVGVALTILANRSFDVLAAGWALIAGVTGMVLVLIGFSPDPAFSILNENLFYLNPGFLGVAVAAWGSRPDLVAARRLAAFLAFATTAGLALELLPSFDQANLPVIAIALPANLGLAIGLSRRRGRPAAPRALSPGTRPSIPSA